MASSEEDFAPRAIKVSSTEGGLCNPSTTIRYNLTQGAYVRLAVYDILGKEVKVVEDGYRSKGVHEVHFSAGALSSGIYIYRISAGNMSLSKKMLFLK